MPILHKLLSKISGDESADSWCAAIALWLNPKTAIASVELWVGDRHTQKQPNPHND